MDNDGEKKKAKGTKKCVIKLQLMFENYKGCLFNDKIISKSQRRFKSVYHNVYPEEINKIDLAVMMIRDCRHWIELQHIHTEKMQLKCVRVK